MRGRGVLGGCRRAAGIRRLCGDVVGRRTQRGDEIIEGSHHVSAALLDKGLDLEVHMDARLAALTEVGAQTEAAQPQPSCEANLSDRPGVRLLPVQEPREQRAFPDRRRVTPTDLQRELSTVAGFPRFRGFSLVR